MCLAQGPQRSDAGEISGLYFPSRLIFFTIEKDGTRCIPKVVYDFFLTQILPFFETKQNKIMLHCLPWHCFKCMSPVRDVFFGLNYLDIRTDTQCLQNFASLPSFTWKEWSIHFYRTFKFFRGISEYNHFRFTAFIVSGVFISELLERISFIYLPE